MRCIPFKHRLEIEHDDSGVSFGYLKVQTGYYCEEHPHFSYLENPVRVPVSEELAKQLVAVFDASLEASCKAMNLIPMEEAKQIQERAFIDHEEKKIEAIDPATVKLSEPIQARVNERVIEILSQKAAAAPQVQELHAKLMAAGPVVDAPKKRPILNFLKKILPYAIL